MGRKKMTAERGGTGDMPSTEDSASEQNSTESAANSDKGMSTSEYFREILKANPALLNERSNEPVYEIWLKDHPGYEKVPKKEMQILSNVKSNMKKERKAGRRGRPRKVKVQASSSEAPRPAQTSSRNLETIEMMLDDCIMLAGKDQEMERVTEQLRRARREVILKMGL